MTFSRREAIAMGGSGLVTALAGCQALASDDPMVTLQINNATPDPQEIQVQIVDPEVDDHSEALVYRPTDEYALEIPPASDGEEDEHTSRVFEDVAESKRYTVYARVIDDDGPEQWRHFHYIPPGALSGHKIMIAIYQDEHTGDGVIEFTR